MEWKYDEGDELFFNCTDSSWSGIHDVKCRVIRRLTEDEADLCETGPMYVIGFIFLPDMDAFEDELTPEPIH